MTIIITFIVAWSFFEASTWGKLFQITLAFAALVTALGAIHTKLVSPWIAKPLAKALRNELKDQVKETLLEPDVMQVFQERIEETFAHESSIVVIALDRMERRMDTFEQEVKARLKKIEDNQRKAAAAARAKAN